MGSSGAAPEGAGGDGLAARRGDSPETSPADGLRAAQAAPDSLKAGESVTADGLDARQAASGSPEASPAVAADDLKASPAAPDDVKAGQADPLKAAQAGQTGSGEAGSDEAPGSAEGGGAGAAEAPRAGRFRIPFAHKLPKPTRKAVVAAAGTVAAWARRPHGRLVVVGVPAALAVAATVAAGAVIVPAALESAGVEAPAAPAAVPSAAPVAPSVAPGGGEPLPTTAPTGLPAAPGQRPADALQGWAAQVAATTGIPPVAVQAYGYAELVLARTVPTCRLNWTTLAAIGKVESAHGSANGATLGVDGQALPPITGLPLDGNGGRMRILDTDQGSLDGDQQFDRAMGPMQFIPTTWRQTAVDADSNGVTDPNDIDDAALAAATYLCLGVRDLSTSEDWWAAILSYNDVRRYAQDVYDAANDYGLKSRT